MTEVLAGAPPGATNEGDIQLVAEALASDFGFYLGASSLLAERRTPMQHIEILRHRGSAA